MKTTTIFIFSIFLFSSQFVHAENFLVSQSLTDIEKAAVKLETENSLEVGDILIAKSADQKNCSLFVTEVKKGIATLDTSKCSFKDGIKAGDSLEKSLISTSNSASPKKIVEIEKAKNDIITVSVLPTLNSFDSPRMSLTAYYSLAESVKFNKGSIDLSGTSVPVSGEFLTETAVGLGLSYGSMPNKGFGYLLSGQFEMPRKIKKLKINMSGSTAVSDAGGTSAVSYLFGEFSRIYRNDKIYFPFGINVSMALRKDGGSGSSSTKPDLGFVIGTGVIINENISFEFLYRVLGYQESGVDSNTNWTYDLGTGYLGGFSIGARYWF